MMRAREGMMEGREIVVMEAGEDMECEEEMKIRDNMVLEEDQHASLVIHGKHGMEPELYVGSGAGTARNGSGGSRTSNSSSGRSSRVSERESMLEEAWERRKRHSLEHLSSDDDQECQMQMPTTTAAMMLMRGDNHYHQRRRRPTDQRVMGRSVSCCGPRGGGRGGSMEDLEAMDDYQSYLMKRSTGRCSGSPASVRKKTTTTTKTLMRSLTDDDFEDLRGCLDLGLISLNYDRNVMAVDDDKYDGDDDDGVVDDDDDAYHLIRHTLPALQLCYCIALQQQQNISSPKFSSSSSASSSPQPTSVLPAWKIANPGDDPQDIKERLRHWAQAVACNLRLWKS